MESVWADQDGAIQCLNFKTVGRYDLLSMSNITANSDYTI